MAADSSSLSLEERSRRTFRWDLLRGVSGGFVEPFRNAVCLLIAIRVFEASEAIKPWFQSAHGIGLLLTPITLAVATRFSWRAGSLSALTVALAGLSLLLAVLFQSLWGFVVGVVLFQVLMPQHVPLMTHTYAQNYPRQTRGQRVSTMFLVLSVVSASVGLGYGFLLDRELDFYLLVTAIVVGFLGVMVVVYTRIPSESIPSTAGTNPLGNFSLLREDKVFRMMIIGWMFMGIGNLMTIPLRVEYIGNPLRFGEELSNQTVTLLIVVIPLIVQITMIKPMGVIFDRWNLIDLRNLLNLFFGLSIILFFITDNLWLIGLAQVFFGLGASGAQVTWNLWVTHVAPADQTGAYMSVHTVMTGLRATVAPFVGFGLIAVTPIWVAATIGTGLVVISSLLFSGLRGDLEVRRKEHQENEKAVIQSRITPRY